MQKPNLSEIHAKLLATTPLVQNITNTVVQQFSANVLLAMDASPAMLDHEADAAQFTRLADALLVNFGTATNQQLLAADAAIATANEINKPWVLDPVSAGSVAFRTIKIRQALASRPTTVRGNASEIIALANMGTGGRGVDSTDKVDNAIPAAVSLARQTGSVIAVSGHSDAIIACINGQTYIARIAGGHKLMTLVVGTGCALGAAVAAYLGSTNDNSDMAAFAATIAAHTHFALAGAKAAERANAPGSFAVAFLDALYELRSDEFNQAKIEIQSLPSEDDK